jgi:dihydrolipoamide dehydrogenase
MTHKKKLTSDITIIGGGPGGIAGAIRSSVLGKKVILIEKNTLGGTAINHGCLQSKFLLYYTGSFQNIHKLNKFGINTEKVEIDYKTLLRNNKALIKKKVKEVKTILKNHDIKLISGYGRIVSSKKILVEKIQEKYEIDSESIIISTGSKPIFPQIPGINLAVTSDLVLRFNRIPGRVIILGGGPEGVEIASIMNNLGIPTRIIELTNRLLPLEDHDIGKYLKQILLKNGNDIRINSIVKSIFEKDGTKTVTIVKGGKEEQVFADLVVLAMGRQPNLDRLGLENLSIKTKNGLIEVDDHMETNIQNVFAAGDVVGGGLVHVAIEQGIVASENASGINSCFNQGIIPHSIYTNPEIASVGLTETQARKSKIRFKIGKSDIRGNDKSSIINEKQGFIKVLIDTSSDQIVGVHMIGSTVSEIISTVSMAMHMKATAKNLSRFLIPYPSITSCFKEAIMNAINS